MAPWDQTGIHRNPPGHLKSHHGQRKNKTKKSMCLFKIKPVDPTHPGPSGYYGYSTVFLTYVENSCFNFHMVVDAL